MGRIASFESRQRSSTGTATRRIALAPFALACLAAWLVACVTVASADDGAVVTADGGLSLRSRPSVESARLAVMPGGTRVTLAGEPVDGFYPVVYDGQSGWAAGAYLRRAEERPSGSPNPSGASRGAATTVALRLRAGPDVTSPVLATMPAGARVDVVEEEVEALWWKVRYGGQTGYAFAEYLSISDVGAPIFDLDLPMPFRRQMTDVWCEAADIQMWAAYNGHSTGSDYQFQQEIWDWELSHNMGFTVEEWNASPYATASAAHRAMPERGFNHFRYDDALEATKAMAWLIANPEYRQPSIALIWRGDHYVLVRGVRAEGDPFADYPRARILGVYVSDPNKGGRRWLGEDRYIPIADWLSNYLTPASYLTPHTGVPGDPWQNKYVTIQVDWEDGGPTEAGRSLEEFRAFAAGR